MLAMRSAVVGLAAVAVGLAGLVAGLAGAQQPESVELVNVDLRNVAGRIADNLKVDASQIPLSVMAPARVAANVCGMEQALMAQLAARGGMGCTADQTTTALDAIVDEQMKK